MADYSILANKEFRNSINSGPDDLPDDIRQPIIVYKRRWLVMLVVVLLNISNAALWITYAPVANYVSDFYQKSNGEVNLFSVVYLIVSMPFCFISTFTVNKVGLKVAIHVGATLNGFGAIIKAIGTSAFIVSKDAQFGISLTGQVISAMAQSFLLFIPTKVSQIWFPEHQRTISTTILSMSNPLGIVFAQVLTPIIIKEAEDVPLNNYIWMAIAIGSQVLTFAFITRSKPPTPASYSSQQSELNRAPYLQQLKTVFTCKPFCILFVVIGFGIAYLSAMATVTQQVLCGLGYSNLFSGLTTALLILVGFVGSAVFGVYVDKTKKFLEVCKFAYGCAAVMGIGMLEFYLVEDMGAAILIFSSLFGFFGVGGYPIGLELAVEATYPVEETISTAFIFLSGQLQGIVVIALISGLSSVDHFTHQDIEVCTVDNNSQIVPKDYTMSMIALMCMLTVYISVLILFLKTDYKRMEADKLKQTNDIPRSNISSLTEISSASNSNQVQKEDYIPETEKEVHEVKKANKVPQAIKENDVPQIEEEKVPEVKEENKVPEVKEKFPEVKEENKVSEVKEEKVPEVTEEKVPEVKKENKIPQVNEENKVPEVKEKVTQVKNKKEVPEVKKENDILETEKNA